MGGSADEQADPRFLVGQVLAGRYWLQEHLGRGAMGDVFRARHAKVPRTFAVKVLHPELVEDPKTCRRFEREAELAGRLHHRNVVSVIDVGETTRSRYLVMEFAEGISLVEVIAGRPLSTSRVLNLAKQICDGLQHAHEHELVHRDLKPENIIVERTGDDEVPRIVDFGLAILRDGASQENVDRLTTRGIVLGTPHYLAPETAMGEEIDHRIDLFALGVILYEMMTGVMPFDGDGVDVARANLHRETPPMGVRAPSVTVDPLLEALVGKLLEKKPADRPQSAREVRQLLDLIDSERDKAAYLLGVKLGPMTQPLPAGLRDPSLQIIVGAPSPLADPRPTGDGVPLERVSSTEQTNRTEQAWFDGPEGGAGDGDADAGRARPGGSDIDFGGEIAPLAQRDVITDRVRLPEPRTTDEMLRASGGRRDVRIAAAAIALLLLVGVVIMRRGSSDQVAIAQAKVEEPVALAVATPPLPTPAPSPVEVPAPVVERAPEVITAALPRPKQQPLRTPVAAPPTEPVTPEVLPLVAPKAEDVLVMYQSLGRELKSIADRRDMAADDLWIRYRRVRIQDVMTDAGKRSEALAILTGIDRDLAKRFR